MRLRRITRTELRAFVAAHHRHAGPPRQAIVKVGIDVGGELVAVACGASPVARALDDGETIEVSRVPDEPRGGSDVGSGAPAPMGAEPMSGEVAADDSEIRWVHEAREPAATRMAGRP